MHLDDVTCRLGRALALDGVSLRVEPGTVHALLGPNGAGKTTLLRVVAGLQRPTTGAVRVAGRRPSPADDDFCRRVTYLASGTRHFYLRLSGRENLLFFARLRGLRGRARRARVDEVLEAVGLEGASRQLTGTYSTGMRKRLGVALALVAPAEVLAVDEATHDLDPAAADRVRELVADQARSGAAVVWATQRLEEIAGWAHDVTVLHRGRVRFDGSVRALVERADTQRFLVRVRAVGDAASTLDLVGAAAGEHAAVTATDEPDTVLLEPLPTSNLGAALARLTDSGMTVLSCSEVEPAVQTAMLRVTRDDLPAAEGAW